jgi:hypothetical protein
MHLSYPFIPFEDFLYVPETQKPFQIFEVGAKVPHPILLVLSQ